MRNMRCPYCGSSVRLRSADGIYTNNGSGTRLYVCDSYPGCDAYVRVHAGTDTPVGNLANAKLRALRGVAHQHFDRLHKSGLMTKAEAYTWLAYMLQSPLAQAHIGYLSEYYCELVISESKKLFDAWRWKLKDKTPSAPITGGVCRATHQSTAKAC